jgi:long-chain acyl-CoA synthetase
MLDTDRLESLGEALRDACVAYKSYPALLEVDRRTLVRELSYREVSALAERLSAGLRASGFAPGDRAAILMSNQSNWLIAALAVFWAGGVLVPLDYKLGAGDQAALVRHNEPRVLLTEWPVWSKLRAEDLGVVRPLVLVHDLPEREPAAAGVGRWESLPAGTFELQRRARGDVATIVYSSGTGGDVKGCMLTHANYLVQARNLGALFPFGPGDRFFSVLPTNHAIDFMSGFVIPFLCGGEVLHQRTLRPEYLSWTMKRYAVTHMAMVPLLLRAFEEKLREGLDEVSGTRRSVLDLLRATNELLTLRAPSHALSSRVLAPVHERLGGRLKLIFAGGAFVDPTLAEFFYRLGFPVVIGYGLTEAGTVLTVNDLKPFRADTVGRPLADVELEIREADAEGAGEVWVRSPTVMAGYFRNEALTAETIVDGWLRTGDVGRVDASGHLKLVGRRRNMIVTPGGKNIYPEDLESAFEGLTGAKELCVFARNYVWNTGGLGDEKLLLVLRPDAAWGEAARAELVRRNRQLPEYKRVDLLLVVDEEFPRTASMKIKRHALAALLRDGTASDDGATRSWTNEDCEVLSHE